MTEAEKREVCSTCPKLGKTPEGEATCTAVCSTCSRKSPHDTYLLLLSRPDLQCPEKKWVIPQKHLDFQAQLIKQRQEQKEFDKGFMRMTVEGSTLLVNRNL